MFGPANTSALTWVLIPKKKKKIGTRRKQKLPHIPLAIQYMEIKIFVSSTSDASEPQQFPRPSISLVAVQTWTWLQLLCHTRLSLGRSHGLDTSAITNHLYLGSRVMDTPIASPAWRPAHEAQSLDVGKVECNAFYVRLVFPAAGRPNACPKRLVMQSMSCTCVACWRHSAWPDNSKDGTDAAPSKSFYISPG